MPGFVLVLESPRRMQDPDIWKEMERRYSVYSKSERTFVVNSMPEWQQALLAAGLKSRIRESNTSQELFFGLSWLGRMGTNSGDCTEPLSRALRHSDNVIKIKAAEIVARVDCDAEEVVPLLMDCTERLYSVDHEDWIVPARALAHFGAEAHSALGLLRGMPQRGGDDRLNEIIGCIESDLSRVHGTRPGELR